ncbi:MAG: hypothetical protein ABI318_07875 [Chthoniobacteraceae bacterium]
MAEPLRWNMKLPDGQPLRWNMGPEYKWDGDIPPSAYPSHPMQQNDLSITIASAQEADFMAAADALIAKIAVFAITITDHQRQGYFKLSDARLPFHEKSRDYMHQNIPTVPGTIDPPEYDKDQAAWDVIGRMIAKAKTILQPLVDTQTVAGADLLSADLAYYNYLPLAAKAGIAGAEDIHSDLKSSYPGRGPAPKPPKPPTP